MAAPRARRRGSMLLVVLVFVAILTIANLTYFDWTFVERRAVSATTRRAQARASAESAIEMLRVYLAQPLATLEQDGGLYNNPSRFGAIPVLDGPQPELRSVAAVVSPLWGANRIEGARFGLEDESGRLNLNSLAALEASSEGAGREQLLYLPGMTEAIADSILDWIDEDETPRTLGAESQYYTSLTPPYQPANGPIASLEQLLLVKGVTPRLLYGQDQDRNHTVTPAEQAAVPLEGIDPYGSLGSGWASLLTLYSAESNLMADGSPKIDVNAEDLELLHDQIAQAIDEATANFIIGYRQGGPEEEDDQQGDGDQPLDIGGGADADGTIVKSAGDINIDFEQPASTPINSLLDLVGVRARVVELDQVSGETLVESPYSESSSSLNADLALMMSTLTTSNAPAIPCRININQAPREVLAGVPGLPPVALEAILANRDPTAGQTRPERLQATWLYAERYIELEDMRAIAPYVTGQGGVFRAQVLGGFQGPGPTVRIEVVIDATASPPRVVMRRDLSPLGIGFDPADVFSPTTQPLAR